MSKRNKVTFKIILTSEIEQPYKVVSVPDEAPFSAVVRYVCGEVINV
jgi:ubiquitin-fold modifier 1